MTAQMAGFTLSKPLRTRMHPAGMAPRPPASAIGEAHGAKRLCPTLIRPSPLIATALYIVLALALWLDLVALPPKLTGSLFLLGALAVPLLDRLRSPPATGAGAMQRRSFAAHPDDPPSGLAKEDLGAAIIHELRQPLSAMTMHGRACLRWIDRDVPDIRAARQSVEHMIANTTRAAEIMAGLNAIARGSVAAPEAIDLRDVILSVLACQQADISAGKVEVTLDAGDRISPVQGRRTELEQVVRNLIVNAVQAMSNIEGPRRLAIVLRQAGCNGQIIAEVRDTGLGFGSERADRLFEPLFTTKKQGMGMGLAISRAIIVSFGGCLEAKPNAGGGACFSIRLNPAPKEMPR